MDLQKQLKEKVLNESECNKLLMEYQIKDSDKRLFYIRHAQSEINAYKHSNLLHYLSDYPNELEFYDPYLTKLGIEQCKKCVELFDKDDNIPYFNIAFVSPLQRTIDTFKNLSQSIKLSQLREVILTPLIRESSHTMAGQVGKRKKTLQNQLEAEGKYNFEFITKEQWWKNEQDDEKNEIENFEKESKSEIMTRIKLFLLWVSHRKEKNILFVSHGIVYDALNNFEWFNKASNAQYMEVQNIKKYFK